MVDLLLPHSRRLPMKRIPTDQVFFNNLRQFDRQNFLEAKRAGCSICKGPLDTANYFRKTRGLANAEAESRYSLCCRTEGCRKRVTPPSLRFLGRRVYFAAVVILAVDFCAELGLKGLVARQTLSRWRAFWAEQLAERSLLLFKVKSLLTPGTPITPTPTCVVSHFDLSKLSSWIPFLKLFTHPI
jgi:hypothetical protein